MTDILTYEEAKKKMKKLEEYQQSKPKQMTLFELLDFDDLRKRGLTPKTRSHTIALYDFMPKYHWGKLEREHEKYLPILKREFEYGGRSYAVSIAPAYVEDADGVTRHYYPGQREELVEDALRKLACEGQGLFLDDQAGVTFTLYKLQQELKKSGHTYSYDELKEALIICNGTQLKVTNETGTAILSSAVFENIGIRTLDDWKETGNQTKCFVRFNSLVTSSIKDKTYRLLNYEKAMRYKSVTARQLHKRMSHHFTYASFVKPPYNILLSTIIRDFGLKHYAQLRDNLRDVKKALGEMKERDVLAGYEIQPVLEAKRRNKLADAKFLLYPSRAFCSEMMKANEWHRDKHKPSAPLLPNR